VLDRNGVKVTNFCKRKVISSGPQQGRNSTHRDYSSTIRYRSGFPGMRET
jgi:hypothetical protein